MIRKFASIKFAGADLPARTIRARITDESVDRAGDIVIAAGCDASNYKRNPVVLWQHDLDKPIATAKVIPAPNALDAEIRFPDPGVSAQSDQAFALVKSGVLTGVSIGFTPIERSPIPGGGVKFTKFELIEISLVTIPANPNARVTQKSATSSQSLAEQAKAALDKAERWHVEALDSINEYRLDGLPAAEALSRAWDAVEKARTHADVATDLVNQLRKLPGADSGAASELAFSPARTKAALAKLDALDLGKAALKEPEAPRELGGAFLTAQVRDDELRRLRRFWS